MASSQKKKTNTKEKDTPKKSTRSRAAAAPEPQRAPAWHRPAWAAVCLLLALCVAVSYFSTDGLLLTLFADGLKGLFGYGYWVSAAALAVAGVNLLRHRESPVVLRTVCTLLLVVVVGVLCHVLLCRESYALGTESLLPNLGSAPASLVAQRLKRLPPMRETRVQSLSWEDPLEKGNGNPL